MNLSQWQRGCKRLIDVIGAAVFLTIALPVLLVVAILIKLTSEGPVLFRQQRSGVGGRLFSILKFRTMTVDTVVEIGRETLSRDPRITAVGRWLRCTGIDELPQLVNVLAGDMSLVGPRPLLAWENDRCDARQALRLQMKPGLTGLSQVNGRNSIPWDERVEWDVRYVERASVGLDLLILVKTLPVALRGENAYRDQQTAIAMQPVAMIDAMVD